MTMSNVWSKNAEITNIQHKRINEESIELTFCMNGLTYALMIEKEEDLFVPWGLFHEFKETCPNCKNQGTQMNCRGWNLDQIKELFYHLIEQPSIRLEWIFIKHKEVAENG